ncbi:UNVERIFIED_CONTAM: Poly(A) polymerase I [Sesamum latifolium]|uniref:Poly(A) polymerase I n=1 Tax=Sesamum latifolium TaxID=2727402 RepID=A0AAW2YDN3_9LAMI
MALSQPSKAKTFLHRMKSFMTLQSSKCSSIEVVGRAPFSSDSGGCSSSDQVEFAKWRKLDSRRLGIAKSMISIPSWTVLRNLRAAGFEAYLVGGCVRDLLLNKVPKDFDVITTARLKQVKKKFRRAIIVGKRFPICRVPIKDSVVEVSSFETVAEQSKTKQVGISHKPTGCDPRDFVRWKNCMHRDFTVNRLILYFSGCKLLSIRFPSEEGYPSMLSTSLSLLFDPFVDVIFDYTDAIVDLRSLKLRTVIPAHLSFKEDEARILRGLRIAARLNLSFSKETEAAIYSLSPLVAHLGKSRIHLEMNYMLSYGAAEPSLLLLKRFKLLEIFLPFHAAYLEQVDNRVGLHSLMLMKLFFNLDQLITCDRPCHDSLWVAILAFHLALFRNPQHALVVLTFASLLYHGTWEETIKFARENALATRIYVPEILDSPDYLADDEIAERVTQFAQQVKNSVDVLINMNCLLKAMTRFPESPCSGLVFVPQNMGRRVKCMYNILAENITSLEAEKRNLEIDYGLLTAGNVDEVRFVLGKIILRTLICGVTSERGATRAKRDDIQATDSPRELEVSEQIRGTLLRLNEVDPIGNNENKRKKAPANYDLSPKNASKPRLLKRSSIAADCKSSGEQGSERSNISTRSCLAPKQD